MDLRGGSFSRIVEEATSGRGMALLGPAVKKEVIHYAVFEYLDRAGWLERMTFQGGTCLRECYGSPRYSEDLDFNVPRASDLRDMTGLAEGLRTSLAGVFGTQVRVRPPSERRMAGEGASIALAKRAIALETDPTDPSTPMQRVKLEVAAVPAYDVGVRFLDVSIPSLPSSLGDIMVRAESPTEICADKLVSFAASRYVRNRDLWDMKWVLTSGMLDRGALPGLVSRKVRDYGLEDRWEGLLSEAPERASRALRADAFRDEMLRFVPGELYDRTVGRAAWADAVGAAVGELYGLVSPGRARSPREVDDRER